MPTPDIATPRETVHALLNKAKRLKGGAPIRRSFVQQGTRARPKPGPLAPLVRNRDRRALDLYLLLRAVVSAEPFESHRGAGVWARALRVTGVSADEAAVSKIWTRLSDLKLVSRSKYGRLANIIVLSEDGSGDPFLPPWEVGDPYLQLPVSYWLNEQEEWSASLSLPAKAMLLIALSLPRSFILPVEKPRNGTGCRPTRLSGGWPNS
jgi:hypothetical protein